MHWFSIVNSLLIVFLLTGMVAVIMLRTLRRDVLYYNRVPTEEVCVCGGVGVMAYIVTVARETDRIHPSIHPSIAGASGREGGVRLEAHPRTRVPRAQCVAHALFGRCQVEWMFLGECVCVCVCVCVPSGWIA